MMTRTRLRRSVSFLIAMLAIVSFNQLSAQPKHAPTVTNVVLVHGTKRAIARITTEQPGPVLLVGPSYGRDA